MPASETATGTVGRSGPVQPSRPHAAMMAWRIVYVRLRFFVVLAATFAVVGNWDFLRDRWQKLIRQTRGASAAGQAESADTEYWCPMCPGVVSDWPSKCSVCNMGLVRRQRGETVTAADGGLARMQLSPYRLQLAGIQTTTVEYRPFAYEVITGGFVQDHVWEDGHNKAIASDPACMWVEAEIYEKDLALLGEGRRVEIFSDGFPGRTPLTAQIRKLLSPTPPSTRSPRVRVEIDNHRLELRPGMFVRVRIIVPPARLEWLSRALTDDWRDRTHVELVGRMLAGPPGPIPIPSLESVLRMACQQAQLSAGQVLTVLESAIIDTGLKKVAYKESGPGMFEAVEVVVGPRRGEFRPVIHGLEAGQRVAAAGAFLLDAETRLNPAVATAYFGAARTPAPARPPKADIQQALDRLSHADRAQAVRQKTCPVTGELLGTMGQPVRVELAGRIVFLCCKACEAELRGNANKYLSKLSEE